MKRFAYMPFLLLILFIFSVMSFSPIFVDNLRYNVVKNISPTWNFFDRAFSLFANIPTFSDNKKQTESNIDLSNLTMENQLLKTQLDGALEWLLFEQRIENQIETVKELSKEKHDDIYWNEFIRRRSEEIKTLLEMQMQSLPAKVIYREPASWSSSIWVNIGKKDNKILEKEVVAKNSPVVVGESLIGVVEYVGENESRIRLITDSGLVPSVRAVRGTSQDRVLKDLVSDAIIRIRQRDDIFSSKNEKEQYVQMLTNLQNKIIISKKDQYLAKGELYGSSNPLWRSKGQLLKGVGFNYDYADKEGPARDIKTGKPFDNENEKELSIIQKGDLLITTGMDGVFPAGLNVATVVSVSDIPEGGYYYDIVAKPTAINLNELNLVFILPPVTFDEKDY